MSDINTSDFTEEELVTMDKCDASKEFYTVMSNWTQWEPNWKKLYPKMKFNSNDIDTFHDLKDINMKVLLKEAHTLNEQNNCFGYLLNMCNSSKFQLGALVSQSFAERMNSAGKQIVRDNRNSLSDDLIEKLVVLRMNKRFIDHCSNQKAKNAVSHVLKFDK